ncbi:MAG: hypothetical protein IJB49_03505 [Clostridia bacterium]|nr:hypothetical protein [Clostridia bacterium]
MSFHINSSSTTKRIFFGIVLLAVAAALICYSIGLGPELSGVPLYKIILGLVLLAWIFKKIFFSYALRHRFQIAIPLALLFMLFEKEIAFWAGLPEENIVNNWLIAAAAIICHFAVCLIIPKSHRSIFSKRIGSDHAFSSEMLYIDAVASPNASVTNHLGNREVFYQNVESIADDATLTLDISNSMGNVEVHVPVNWQVVNNMETSMANTEIRANRGFGPKLIITGRNRMGNVEIES